MRWNYWCLPIVLKELSNLWRSLFCFLLCDLLLIIMKCKMPFTKHWNPWWNVSILGTSKSKFLYYIIHKNWFMYIQNVKWPFFYSSLSNWVPFLATMLANILATMSTTLLATLSTSMSATMCTSMTAAMAATAMSSRRFVRSQRRTLTEWKSENVMDDGRTDDGRMYRGKC